VTGQENDPFRHGGRNYCLCCVLGAEKTDEGVPDDITRLVTRDVVFLTLASFLVLTMVAREKPLFLCL
jgi:hypothetical protein